MTKEQLEKRIRKQAGDLIYCWLRDSDKQYLGKNANVLLDKRDRQVAYLKGLAYAVSGASEEDIYAWILDEIKNTYQQIKNPATGQWENATPRLIIAALMVGETVKGKNWKKGIYGVQPQNAKVGITDMTGLSLGNLTSGNYDVVDTSWSKSYSVGNIYPNYDFSVSSYKPASVSLVDTSYSYVNNFKLNTTTGKYDLATVSNGSETITTDGTQLSWKDQPLWDNIANCAANIQGLINGMAEFLSGLTAADALVPAQVNDGWVAPSGAVPGSTNAGVSTGLLIGGALLAAGFISNDTKRK